MRTIWHTDTLVFYDGVQVFEGRDSFGGHYVGVMTDSANDVDSYLVTGAAPELLRRFRSGSLDLKTLLLEGAAYEDEWYTTQTNADFEQPLVLDPQRGLLIETDLLPDDGFVLTEVPVADDLALVESLKRWNVVFEFSVEPPETADGHRIRSATLGGLLIQLQTVLRHAYRSVVRNFSARERRAIDTTDAYLMNVVVPASPGSYRVILEAAKPPDMFGYGELVRALRRMDEIFRGVDEENLSQDSLWEYRGHLAGSYLNLMKILEESQTGLRYSWAEPSLSNSVHGGISESQVRNVVEMLSGSTELGTESVVLVGEFERVNRSAGDWGLLTDEGVRSGKTRGNELSLNGLEVGKRYRFECLDDIEIVDASGLEKHTLYLINFEPL